VSFKAEKKDLSGFCQILGPKCSSLIVSTFSNDDFSAQNSPRDMKLVLLELPVNEDSEYAFKIFLGYILTKRQCKIFGNTIFQSLGGGGCCGTNLLRDVVEIATLYELMKMIDSSLPHVAHICVTLSDFFFTHFTITGHKR
jgi:hypothetical protein